MKLSFAGWVAAVMVGLVAINTAVYFAIKFFAGKEFERGDAIVGAIGILALWAAITMYRQVALDKRSFKERLARGKAKG